MDSNSDLHAYEAFQWLSHLPGLVYGLSMNHILKCLARELAPSSSTYLVVVMLIIVEWAATSLAH